MSGFKTCVSNFGGFEMKVCRLSARRAEIQSALDERGCGSRSQEIDCLDGFLTMIGPNQSVDTTVVDPSINRTAIFSVDLTNLVLGRHLFGCF